MLIPRLEQAEAVVFFEQQQVAREMLYTEFEAILDGYIPVPELKASQAQLVYVRINANLCITAAVFFTLDFDVEGYADKQWNIPLQQLADSAAQGPDMGAGFIALSCRSQCSIGWQQQKLWDPEMASQRNSFSQLRKAAAGNRLSLMFEPEAAIATPVAPATTAAASPVVESAVAASAGTAEPPSAELSALLQQQLQQDIEQEYRTRLAQKIKEQRLHVASLKSQHQAHVQSLQTQQQQRVQQWQSQLQQQQQQLQEAEALNTQLQQTLTEQAQQVEELREGFELRLSSLQADEATQLALLHDNYGLELQTKLTAATTELKQMLQVNELELAYLTEQQEAWHGEVARLRDENSNLLGNSGDQLLGKLTAAGINFVSFHPGAGHLTINAEDMAAYLDNPQEYVAKTCGVSRLQYQNWLAHYQSPVCQALADNGQCCGEALERIAVPSDFYAGESDRCAQHSRGQQPAANDFDGVIR